MLCMYVGWFFSLSIKFPSQKCVHSHCVDDFHRLLIWVDDDKTPSKLFCIIHTRYNIYIVYIYVYVLLFTKRAITY